MISVDHPFIVDLVATFQDEHKLYMLENYVQGGELFGLIYNVSKKGYLVRQLQFSGFVFIAFCLILSWCSPMMRQLFMVHVLWRQSVIFIRGIFAIGKYDIHSY